jgi:hypothetical protein
MLTFSSTPLPTAVLEAIVQSPVRKLGDRSYALELPPMSHEDYQACKKVMVALRGMWSSSKQAHLFSYDPTAAIASLIQAGTFPKTNPHQFHPTPEIEIEDLLDFIGLCDWPWQEDITGLEPSAGDGRLALAAQKRSPRAKLDVVEIDPFNREILAGLGLHLVGSDWLKTTLEKEYDFVVLNPPFKGTQYVDHTLKAFDALKMFRQLGAIVPEIMLSDSSPKVRRFRNLIAECGWWEPIGAPFKTTKTRCLMIRLDRLSQAERDRGWQQMGAYESRYHCDIEQALETDGQWYEFMQSLAKEESKAHVKAMLPVRLTQAVERMIREEYCCFLYNDRVKAQLMRSLLRELGLEPDQRWQAA